MPYEGTIALNNYLQSRNELAILSWHDISTGPAHSPEWTSDCKINGKVIAVGTGSHKHIARDVAAKEALRVLTNRPI